MPCLLVTFDPTLHHNGWKIITVTVPLLQLAPSNQSDAVNIARQLVCPSNNFFFPGIKVRNGEDEEAEDTTGLASSDGRVGR